MCRHEKSRGSATFDGTAEGLGVLRASEEPPLPQRQEDRDADGHRSGHCRWEVELADCLRTIHPVLERDRGRLPRHHYRLLRAIGAIPHRRHFVSFLEQDRSAHIRFEGLRNSHRGRVQLEIVWRPATQRILGEGLWSLKTDFDDQRSHRSRYCERQGSSTWSYIRSRRRCKSAGFQSYSPKRQVRPCFHARAKVVGTYRYSDLREGIGWEDCSCRFGRNDEGKEIAENLGVHGWQKSETIGLALSRDKVRRPTLQLWRGVLQEIQLD